MAEVKICGLRRREDARHAEEAGADYLGIILSTGFGRSVSLPDAAALVADLHAIRVAVLVDESVSGAVAAAEAVGAGVLQLHGSEPRNVVAALAAEGRWRIWKSVRARTPEDLARAAEEYGDVVDGVLVEGYREGVVGGGGARLDLDPFLRTRSSLPERLQVVLAGGLTPDTVADAVARFRPHVVDVSSGVERTRGEKDPALVRRFIEEARRGTDRVSGAPSIDPQGDPS